MKEEKDERSQRRPRKNTTLITTLRSRTSMASLKRTSLNSRRTMSATSRRRRIILRKTSRTGLTLRGGEACHSRQKALDLMSARP